MSRILASYNLVSLPVVDENHRLVGVVTIDDVLDYLLPDDWRSTAGDDEPEPVSTGTAAIPTRGRRTRMARARNDSIRLDSPKGLRPRLRVPPLADSDRFGRFTEAYRARRWAPAGSSSACRCSSSSGSPATPSCPSSWSSSTRAPLGFTLLTLILSLQASYAAPLILLAQNRQDDRDRVQIEQDRQRAERNLADTEYLAREVVALRLAMKDVATKDFIRGRAALAARGARQGQGAGRGRPSDLRLGRLGAGGARPRAGSRDPAPDHRARHGARRHGRRMPWRASTCG